MKKLLTIFSFGAIVALAGCVDRDFDLANTSGEITIGGEELVVPLGSVDKIYMSDLLKDNEVIKSDADGIYQIYFSSFGQDPTKYEQFSIEGIDIPSITGLTPDLLPLDFTFQQMPSQLSIAGISKSVEVDIPTIDRLVAVAPIKISQPITVSMPTTLPQQGTLPDEVASQLPQITYGGNESVSFSAEVSILEQLRRVNWVTFGCEEHPFGAPFTLAVDLNGLQNINNGGTFSIEVKFPSNFHLRDEGGNEMRTANNIFQKEVTFAKGQRTLEITLYLDKFDLSDKLFTDGILDINENIEYSYSVTMGLCGGAYNLDAAPSFSLTAAPKYKDVEVVINEFDLPNAEYDLTYDISGLPRAIAVEKAAFKSAPLTFMLKGLEWISVQDNLTGESFTPSIAITLPQSLHFRTNAMLDSATNTITASAQELAKGVVLDLEYIDATSSEIIQGNGSLKIDSKISARIDLASLNDKTILASSLTPPVNPLTIEMNILDALLDLDLENTKVVWTEEQVFDFNLDKQVPTFNEVVDIPSEIGEVECIEIGKLGSESDPVSITVSLGAMDGVKFPVEELELDVDVNLGKIFRPTAAMMEDKTLSINDNGDYILSIKQSWRPNETTLTKTIQFDALHNLPPIVDGKMTISQNLPVMGSVKIKSGENINLETENSAQIKTEVLIDDIEIRSFTGKLNIAVAPEPMSIELGNMGDLGVDINSLKLNPVLDIKLKDNPTGIPFNANVALKGYDTEGKEMLALEVPTIAIAGTGATNIVLSTPKNRAKYDTEGVTFVAIEELSDMLSNGIPASIVVNMSVAADNTKNYTIDLRQAKSGYSLEYQYEVTIPLEFDGYVDIGYESVLGNMADTFATLADDANGLTLGDVALLAEFSTTIPFDIVLNAWFVDAEGKSEGLAAKIRLENNIIQGYNPQSDSEPRTSQFDLNLDLGESRSLAALKGVDGIKFRFTLYNTDAESVALMKDQFLAGKVKLRVRNGVTVDIFELLNNTAEEE